MDYAIGGKYIATRTNECVGYRRGDVIQITGNAVFTGDYIGKNLSRPTIKLVYIGDRFKGKPVYDDEPNLVEEFDSIIIGLKRRIIMCGCFGFVMGLITGLGTFIWWR